MAQAKSPDAPTEVPVEASAAETQPAAPEGGEKKVVTNVWAPAGLVPKASVLQTAIQSVRDAIPVVYQLEAEITGSKKSTQDKQEGTSFEVTITYTPRAVVGKPDPVDLDKVIKGLDVPRSFDGIGGHDGDPDFLERKPAEL
jgi:hypothetical protein